MLGPASIDTLKTSLRGDLLQPDDAGYEVARKVYNGMIDRRPRYIVCCSNVADVLAAVKFVGKPQLLVAVRGGGHNGAGLGTCDDGLVIDLSRLRAYVSIRSPAPSRWKAAASGWTSIMPRTPSAWPRPAASFLPLALAG
jgi:FAD/FMN-containing dehydrogenase